MARESIRQKLERERAQWRPNTPKKRRSVRMLFMSTVLTLEGLSVAFATLTTIGLYRSHPLLGWMLAAGVFVALACLLTCAVLSRPWGIKLGWVLQVFVISLGFLIPAMFIVAAGFLACWIYAVVKGKQIDDENARREIAEQAWRAEHG